MMKQCQQSIYRNRNATAIQLQILSNYQGQLLYESPSIAVMLEVVLSLCEMSKYFA